MMNKVIKNLYTMATILFVVGGLLIYQGEESGSMIISIGLLMNVVYRLVNLDKTKLVSLKMLDILKLCSAVFLAVTVVLFFIDFKALEYVVVAIIFDVIVNIEDILRGKVEPRQKKS